MQCCGISIFCPLFYPLYVSTSKCCTPLELVPLTRPSHVHLNYLKMNGEMVLKNKIILTYFNNLSTDELCLNPLIIIIIHRGISGHL